MSRIGAALCVWLATCVAVVAQGLTGLARLDAEPSVIADSWGGGAEVELHLSQGVPFRVFTLEGPPRLVVDFSEVEFGGTQPRDILPEPGYVRDLRFGAFRPGWSRLVADLAEPMLPRDVAMRIDPQTSAAVLSMSLSRVGAEAFAAASGAPDNAGWLPEQMPVPAPSIVPGTFTVVLDPGHGGIDPGAERDGLVEKVIVLDVALKLRDRLRRQGVEVVLTRTKDEFVSLEGRTALAHRVGGSLFLSLHADALSQGGAAGATVYTLSEKASDAASAQLAARHDRSDILAGVDLSGADDEVTRVLLDIARLETESRSVALADSVISALDRAGGPMNRKPWRKAGFSVLKSADIPSVLVELGFLSSARDRKNLADPEWLDKMTDALAQAVLNWRDADAARKLLVRQ